MMGTLGFDFAAGEHRLVQFFQVAERFKHQQIDAAFDECGDLLAKRSARLFKRSFAQRLDADTQRANRPGHPDVETLGCFAGHVRAGHVDVAHAIGQAMARETEAIGAEGIGFNNLGARPADNHDGRRESVPAARGSARHSNG